jgi:hypothetical protein
MPTIEERETNTVDAALAANPPSLPPMAYGSLATPYPVWAAIHECGVPRKDNRHRTVSEGLLHDYLRTCIDLAEIHLNRYFKTMASYKVTQSWIIFTIPERNAMITFIQWGWRT